MTRQNLIQALTLASLTTLIAAHINRQPARILARRVVRAPDEAAITPQLQSQPPRPAGRAHPRIRPVLPRRKEMRPKVLVQRIDDISDLQVTGLLYRFGELRPEVAHDLAPLQRPGGNLVEFFLKARSESGIHVMLEEANQERRHQPTTVLRNKPPLVQLHIVPILQHRQDRGVR